MKDFFELEAAERANFINKASRRLGLPFEIIEKDVWLCWILKHLFQLPAKMTFKGGTSLSKMGYIKRFSEDIDVTIDYSHFLEKTDLMKISNSQLKKISKKLKEELNLYISETIVPMLKAKVQETFEHRNEKGITITQTGENVEFKYSTSEGGDYLLDHVLLEFGARNTTEPSELQEIKPYVFEELKNIAKVPTPKIAVLSPVRTFWEKATLAHVECNKKRLSTTHGYRMSRHWYDLYWLSKSDVGSKAIQNSVILKEVLCVKKAFYNSAQAFYDECIEGNLKLVPEPEELMALEKDYKEMINSGMFLKLPESFESMIKSIKELENKINQTMLR